MVTRVGLTNQDLEFVQFHPTGKKKKKILEISKNEISL